MGLKDKTLNEAREISDLAWVFVDEGAYFSGAARLRDAAAVLDDIGHKKLAVLREIVASKEGAS